MPYNTTTVLVSVGRLGLDARLPQLLLGVHLTGLGPSAFLTKTMPSRHTS